MRSMTGSQRRGFPRLGLGSRSASRASTTGFSTGTTRNAARRRRKQAAGAGPKEAAPRRIEAAVTSISGPVELGGRNQRGSSREGPGTMEKASGDGKAVSFPLDSIFRIPQLVEIRRRELTPR